MHNDKAPTVGDFFRNELRLAFEMGEKRRLEFILLNIYNRKDRVQKYLCMIVDQWATIS